jgi:hypothetical protein
LYGLQKSVARRPALYSSYCLNGVGIPRRGFRSLRGDRAIRTWLSARLALSAPEPPLGAAPDPSVNLADISAQTHCSYLDTDDIKDLGRQLQLDSYVLSVRSFDNDQDLYQINNVVQFQPGSYQSPTYDFEIQRFGAGNLQNISAKIDFAEPASQNVSVSYTNSSSTTVSGSVGFNQSQGVNATVGASITVGQSRTVSVPPVIISNQTTLSPPFPKWTFKPTAASVTNELFSAEADWVWTVDQAAYGTDGGEGTTGTISFQSNIGIADFAAQPACSTAPYPFAEWTVSPPQIISFSQPSVSRGGGVFTINGAQMYPGLVTAVLVAGDALPPANYVTSSDSAIRVTIPLGVPTGLQPVEVQTTFNGKVLPSNDMSITVTR